MGYWAKKKKKSKNKTWHIFKTKINTRSNLVFHGNYYIVYQKRIHQNLLKEKMNFMKFCFEYHIRIYFFCISI